MKKTLVSCLALLCACSSSSSNHNQNPNCQPGTGTTLNASCDPGFTQTAPNKPLTVQVTFSGEALGVNGLPFPGNGIDPVFVDGWSVSFDELLIVVGNFRLAPGATQSANQSQVGAPVATMAGPYVLDMHKPTGFTGKEGQPAGGIFKWDTDDSGNAFDNNTRYAFSYDVLRAAYPATQVNLTPDQFADYAMMVQNGWSKLYRGTATYSGTGTYTPDAAVQAKFAALPSPIHFVFGWNDAGSHINCINPDFGNGEDLANRGVLPTSNGAVYAQVTLHVDHVFWDKLKDHNDIRLRFDPVAAWAPAGSTALNPFDLRTIGSKPIAATFSDGTALPDRGPYQNVPGGYACDTPGRPCAQVTLNPNGVTPTIVSGLADFMAFSAQSQMHLNADGLCYDVGQQASDPFFIPGI